VRKAKQKSEQGFYGPLRDGLNFKFHASKGGRSASELLSARDYERILVIRWVREHALNV
jgi:hypothetical protein